MTTERHDLYGPIHKGLRAAQTSMLVQLGSNDWTDARATAELLTDLRRLLELAAIHLEDEDRFIHPLLASRDPDMVERLARDHGDHRRSFDTLLALAARIDETPARARAALGRQLYLAFSSHLAEDLEHMLEEENVVQPRLHALFTDAELIATEQALIAAIAPGDFAELLQMMLPAMNPAERAHMLGGVRASAPPEAFAMIVDIARPALTPADWARVETDLALAA